MESHSTVTRNTSLRVSYLGNHGSNLEQRLAFSSAQSQLNYQMQTGLAAQTNADLRRPNPNWSGIDIAHVGYSNASSVQAEVQRRFSSGLAFQWFYTYNHTMTTSNESAGGSGGGASSGKLDRSRESESQSESEARSCLRQLCLGPSSAHVLEWHL